MPFALGMRGRARLAELVQFDRSCKIDKSAFVPNALTLDELQSSASRLLRSFVQQDSIKSEQIVRDITTAAILSRTRQ
eukprot:5078031-Pleurochrysis_carterae.AAC.3